MIPGPETLPEVLALRPDFCDRRLGKGVVPCKDTPNFIANRIGSFLRLHRSETDCGRWLTIEEVDALTGPLIGLPKSASYRLLDIVGLDVWAHRDQQSVRHGGRTIRGASASCCRRFCDEMIEARMAGR